MEPKCAYLVGGRVVHMVKAMEVPPCISVHVWILEGPLGPALVAELGDEIPRSLNRLRPPELITTDDEDSAVAKEGN